MEATVRGIARLCASRLALTASSTSCAAAPAVGRAPALAAALWSRGMATEGEGSAEAAKTSKEAFLKKWAEVVPSTIEPPMFASDFTEKSEPLPEGSAVPEKVTFSFYLPHGKPYTKQEVSLVLVPAVTGDFGVMPGHVPTVAQLRPGVLSVQEEADGDFKKFFVSSGFAFVHADSTTDVCAVEAVPVEDLDPESVKAGLAEYTAKLASAGSSGDDYEAAAAQVGVEVFSAMNAALGEK